MVVKFYFFIEISCKVAKASCNTQAIVYSSMFKYILIAVSLNNWLNNFKFMYAYHCFQFHNNLADLSFYLKIDADSFRTVSFFFRGSDGVMSIYMPAMGIFRGAIHRFYPNYLHYLLLILLYIFVDNCNKDLHKYPPHLDVWVYSYAGISVLLITRAWTFRTLSNRWQQFR